jgi:hypothetical protein
MIKSRRIGWAGHIACTVGKPEGKRPLGRPRHRWEDIKMYLREIGWGGMDWIDLAQDRTSGGLL